MNKWSSIKPQQSKFIRIAGKRDRLFTKAIGKIDDFAILAISLDEIESATDPVRGRWWQRGGRQLAAQRGMNAYA